MNSARERKALDGVETSPMISVIIPTYNRAHMLAGAIKSVIRQTRDNFEIIVVDDASIDCTEDVVKMLKDPRICYVRHKENRGGSAARNTGIRIARGQYIAFLDSDDEWLPEKLDKQLHFLQMGKFHAVSCAQKFVGTGKTNGEISFYREGEVRLRDLIRSNCIGSASAFVAESSVFKTILFDESLKQSQDWDLYLGMLKMGFRIGFINKPYVIVRDDVDRYRITTSIQNIPLREMEKFTVVFEKHKASFGWWFYNLHKADKYLSYLLGSRHKKDLIIFTVRQTNILSTAAVMTQKLKRHVKRIIVKYMSILAIMKQKKCSL